MKIKTITCHDVYNLGASLQAYALAEHFKQEDHDVQIIDYKPDYLSHHYQLDWVGNPRYDKPLIRYVYLLAKLPGRLNARRSVRKRNFDAFRKEYLPTTERCYRTLNELLDQCPEADLYVAGSDQIWNPVFPNGKDPAFFLAFVPDDKKKISYAASFAVEEISQEDRPQMKIWLKKLDAISVRESSGVKILNDMGCSGEQVVDPVFLLPKEMWYEMAIRPAIHDYILVYDFDNSAKIREIAQELRRQTGMKIVSLFPADWADKVWKDAGPREFLGAVVNAGMVLSNSFHATAFAMIFHKDFYVVNREEGINARMKDLVGDLGLGERLVHTTPAVLSRIDYEEPDVKLNHKIAASKRYLKTHTQNNRG